MRGKPQHTCMLCKCFEVAGLVTSSLFLLTVVCALVVLMEQEKPYGNWGLSPPSRVRVTGWWGSSLFTSLGLWSSCTFYTIRGGHCCDLVSAQGNADSCRFNTTLRSIASTVYHVGLSCRIVMHISTSTGIQFAHTGA